MPWCPVCRSEYRDGFTECSDDGAALVAAEPPPPPIVDAVAEEPTPDPRSVPTEMRTAYLGRYDEFEAPIVLDLLDQAQIAAFPKVPLEEADHSMYIGNTFSDRGILLCDAERVDEALALIAEELPRYIEQVRLDLQNGESLGTEPAAPPDA